MRADGGKLKELRSFILSNPCRFIEVAELSTLCGIDSWQPHLQYLIDCEGYDILVSPALAGNGPHCIFLKSDRQSLWYSEHIPTRVKRFIEERGDLACKSCGRTQGDADPTTSGRRLRLFVSQLVDPLKWSGPACQNIEVLCLACREGLEGFRIDRPSARKLKVQLRRAKGEDQLDVLRWLVKKYPDQARISLKSQRLQKFLG